MTSFDEVKKFVEDEAIPPVQEWSDAVSEQIFMYSKPCMILFIDAEHAAEGIEAYEAINKAADKLKEELKEDFKETIILAYTDTGNDEGKSAAKIVGVHGRLP